MIIKSLQKEKELLNRCATPYYTSELKGGDSVVLKGLELDGKVELRFDENNRRYWIAK